VRVLLPWMLSLLRQHPWSSKELNAAGVAGVRDGLDTVRQCGAAVPVLACAAVLPMVTLDCHVGWHRHIELVGAIVGHMDGGSRTITCMS
jgi:hypothetical protein